MEYKEKSVPLCHIVPGRYQPRQHFDEDEMLALAKSIEEHGIQQLPAVFTNGRSDWFELIFGERRWRASCAMGLVSPDMPIEWAVEAVCKLDWFEDEMPCWTDVLLHSTMRVRVATTMPANVRELTFIENLQRAELSPIEEGQGYLDMIEGEKITVMECARRLGTTNARIDSRIIWFRPGIPAYIREAVQAKKFPKSADVAKAILDSKLNKSELKSAFKEWQRRGYGRNQILSTLKRIHLLRGKKKSKPELKIDEVPSRPVFNPREITATAAPHSRLFGPDAIELFEEIAEEVCSECSVRGLSKPCATCPGFLEFAAVMTATVEKSRVGL